MACGLLWLRSRFFLILWILLNTVIFIITYHKYQKPQYYYVYSILGRGLCVSRASAAIINLNAALVLLPVSRGLNSVLFRTLNRLSRPLLTMWLASLKDVHITLATTIIIASLVHSMAHLMNAENFSHYFNNEYPEINWAKYKGQSSVVLVLTSVVGLTGVCMLVILGLMTSMSLQRVRDQHYHLFWATHFLFLPFMVCLLLHPLSGVLKVQRNFSPQCNSTASYNSSNLNLPYGNCTIRPVFGPMECQGWLWVVAALGVFSADLVARLCRRNSAPFRVSRVVSLPAGVTQLTLITNWTMPNKPGQYVLLQCPRLSSLEWHPFTITSISNSSSHTVITVLIRRRGDWTKTLCKMLSKSGIKRILDQNETPPRILVDGPFCSPMENILKSQVAICIGAGIGITPFIATLGYLYKSDCVRWARPLRLHLVWLVRSADQLIWAADLISALHHKCWYSNQPDRFDVKIFITRKRTGEQLQESNPFNCGVLEKRTYFGRPVWTDLFIEWGFIYKKKAVSVFTCGPQPLVHQIKVTAKQFNRKGYNFRCIHESFS